jgi:hypothetical protein
MYLRFELDVLSKVEFVRIQVKVFDNIFIMHVDWEFLGNGIITVAHHLLTGVHDSGLHYACLTVDRFLCIVPQAA